MLKQVQHDDLEVDHDLALYAVGDEAGLVRLVVEVGERRRVGPLVLPLDARAKRDAALKVEVRRVFEENFRVYGVRKVWRQLQREGFEVARCTVARLMRELGLQGAIRGRPARTTVSDKAAPCPLDHVNRQFHAPAPNRLIPGGLPTEALVADVLEAKYANHLPLYRQAQMFAREGVQLNRATLAHWVGLY